MIALGDWSRFAAVVLAAAAGLAAVGWWPTRQVAGEAGVAAMLAGCAVAAGASIAGGLVLFSGALEPQLRPLAATGLRLAAVVVLGAAVAVLTDLATRPLLVWLALAYLGLLVVDTRWAVKLARQQRTTTTDVETRGQ